MTANEHPLLAHVQADNYAALYRCRWSAPDAEALVPQLAALLSNPNPVVVDEALRSLFRIGSPAASAAPEVAKLTRSSQPITRRLAVQTLGQIAHGDPERCVAALTELLTDETCCRDVLRILAFIGTPARQAYDAVTQLYAHRDARVRKAVVETAAAIADERSAVVEFLKAATRDGSKIVRDVAQKRLANLERS